MIFTNELIDLVINPQKHLVLKGFLNLIVIKLYTKFDARVLLQSLYPSLQLDGYLDCRTALCSTVAVTWQIDL